MNIALKNLLRLLQDVGKPFINNPTTNALVLSGLADIDEKGDLFLTDKGKTLLALLLKIKEMEERPDQQVLFETIVLILQTNTALWAALNSDWLNVPSNDNTPGG